MFDDLNNNSGNQDSQGKKTEDIFASVDNVAQPEMPKPPVFQPKDPSVEVPPLAIETDNKKYFLLGAVVLGTMFIVAGGWYALKSFSSGKAGGEAGVATQPVIEAGTNPAAESNPVTPTAVGSAVETAAALPQVDSSATDTASTTATSSAVAAQIPGAVDSDNDGLTDEEEKGRGTDAKLVDTDSDGLFDYEEVKVYNSNPLVADSDGDTFSDGQEVKGGYNPLGAGKLFDITKSVNTLNNK